MHPKRYDFCVIEIGGGGGVAGKGLERERNACGIYKTSRCIRLKLSYMQQLYMVTSDCHD